MQNNSGATAKAYYQSMANKDIKAITSYIHDDIELSGPLSQVKGKENMLNSIQGFMNSFNSINIKAVTESGDKAVIIFDLECPQPIGKIPSAAFMTIKDGLIIRSQLFFDARPFMSQN